MKLLAEFRRGWQGLFEPSISLSAGFAVLCLAGGTCLRWIVALARPDSPFSLYVPALVLASIFGGPRVGTATLFAGGLLGFLLDFGNAPKGIGLFVLLAIYTIIGILVIGGVAHYRSLLARQREFSDRLLREETYRKLVVDELQHRLRNKIATILALINQSLPNHPDAVATLSGRIRALSATDDLISKADAHGSDLQKLLTSELGPYGNVRFVLDGQPISLPGKLAASLALVFHELATNAAKHGAFSSANGILRVSWWVDQEVLNITWDEAEGPPVASPSSFGFGTKLLRSALLPFEGTVNSQFLQTGLRCSMRCKIPPPLDS